MFLHAIICVRALGSIYPTKLLVALNNKFLLLVVIAYQTVLAIIKRIYSFRLEITEKLPVI
jgi:hypothetical protein